MDLKTVDGMIERHQAEASSLIQILLDVQKEYNWLPPAALKEVSGKLKVPMSRIQHVATFYKAFSMVPKGRHRVNICMGTACHVRGASKILDTVQERAKVGPGETDLEHKFSVETVNCLGCCALGPVIDINGKIHGRLRRRTNGLVEERHPARACDRQISRCARARATASSRLAAPSLR